MSEKKRQRVVAVPKLSFSYTYRNGIARGGAPKYRSPMDMEERINRYFESLVDVDGEIVGFPTISGLALSLGFASINGLYSYQKKPEFKYLVDRARTVIVHFYETCLTTRQSPTGAIFALKNLGWKDTPDGLTGSDAGATTIVSQLAWEEEDPPNSIEDAQIEIIDDKAESEVSEVKE